MNKIELHHALPEVFAACETFGQSDVWNTDLCFERGQLYLIEAASGTGKSSLCSFIIGFRNDYRGTITFDGEDIRRYTVNRWAGLRCSSLAYMFQELRLFPELTAYENVEIKNRITACKTRKQIEDWFEALGIGDKLNAKIGQMSFGQQQRVALMRSLVQPFDFLLIDEPVSHLDEANGRIMGDILLEEVKAQGAGLIATSIGKHISLLYDKHLRL